MNETRNCVWCGVRFTLKSPNQTYCTLEHTRLAKIDRRQRGEQVVRVGLDPRACLWCQQSFVPSDTTQVFCCKTHRTKANLAKGELRGACPRPEKVAYASSFSAERHAERLLRSGYTDLQAYSCSCGKWHLGHSNDSLRENLIKRIGY